ncbi:bile acid:sodium symporter family protein [Anditalea andensis]|uniref:Membrane protein n=1 Tax=Anditalea andensis TaxID=1048983 RepID=A0A074KRJ0_9BACT|nr:bile acid:sodium symporter family protein [Anditalea andensis]KEO72556.1 membrane protein [Anditalea andensis]
MGNIKANLAKVGINGFFFALILMVLLAYLFPYLGEEEGLLPWGEITDIGVFFIFFFYGVKLSPAQLKAGLSNYKLHLLIQGSTFVIFPFLILTIHYLSGAGNSYMWIGVFYLAALPSTVSSSVVMVSIAGGNMPAAIFNASISSLIGILITPLWMGVFMDVADAGIDLTSTVIKLGIQILLPVTLGFLFHKKLGDLVAKNQKKLKNFDQAIILLIVFTAFAESFAKDMFQGNSLADFIYMSAAMAGLFILIMGIMWGISKWMGFVQADTITVLFCGSKKSLVQGAVMGKVLFPDPLIFGIVLLPLMIYHSLQLLMGSAIAERFAAKNLEERRVN